MTPVVRGSLFLVSVLSGMYSFASWAAGFELDAYVSSVVGVCAAGGVFLIDHLEDERRRRMVAYRARVWGERDGRTLSAADEDWLHRQDMGGLS